MLTLEPYFEPFVNYPLINTERMQRAHFGSRMEAMATLRNIAVHHAGGLGNNAYASTRHLTVDHINNAHKARWNFPSKFINGRGSYAGYNFIYDPKDRTFTQCRAIGEETAAQYGHNFDTVSICIIGNFMRKPLSNPTVPVDPLTSETKEDITKFLYGLINQKPVNGIDIDPVVAPGAVVDLSISRVQPHRYFQSTNCYGTAIANNFFRDLLIRYKPVVVTAPDGRTKEQVLEERNALLQVIMQLLARLTELNRMLERLGSKPVGAHERSCTGHLEITD